MFVLSFHRRPPGSALDVWGKANLHSDKLFYGKAEFIGHGLQMVFDLRGHMQAKKKALPSSVYRIETYWANSTDRRNISKLEVLYGTTMGLDNGADKARADALAGPTGRQSAGDQTDVLEVYRRGDAE